MTDEPANLVLDLLRDMRGDMDALRTETRSGFATVRERLEASEPERRGVTDLMSSSTGSLLDERQDHGTGITRLGALRP